MSYVFQPAAQASLTIDGTDELFPVRRIFCVGRNYAAHTVEMGGDPDREDPFFFTKPADAVWQGEGVVPYPSKTNDLHHEIELVIAIGKGAADIRVDDALNHVFGYGAGVDLTRRDLQADAKDKRRPWDMSKGFDHSAPISSLKRASDIGHPTAGAVVLSVNNEVRQQGDLNQQIWKVPEIVSYLSGYVELQPGDLIMTGTPSGVGSVAPGERVDGSIEGIGTISFTMSERP